MKTTSIVLPLMAIAALLVVGCNESADERLGESACNDANTFSLDGARYCIVIEEGFLSASCPDGLPNGRDFDAFFVCSDADEIPDAIEDEARERGFIGTPPLCEEGTSRPAGDGCNTCLCEDGEWSCSVMGCLECTDGETRPADDGCNTCFCEGGVWSCTEIACGECTDGETRPADDGCNTCECENGTWDCTTIACAECTDGETRPAGDGCNTCSCVGGAWLCTTIPCTDFEGCIAGCTDCEDPTADDVTYIGLSAEECTLIDFVCAETQTPFANACGCGCIGLDTAVCEEGDTRMEDCNDCTCLEGDWVCTDRACGELEACLEACGIGCPAPAFQSCGEDGVSYCSDCEAGCYGVSVLPDREACECVPPSGERVDAEEWAIPEGCFDIEPEGGVSGSAYNIFDAAAWFTCEPGASVEVAAGEEVLVRAVFEERPDAAFRGVFRDREADQYTVYLTAPQYCGGPAPTSSVRYFMLPFGDETQYLVDTCSHTECTQFFP
jgi:hypothetical protein